MPTCDAICTAQTFGDDLKRVVRASTVARTVRACLLTTRDRDHALAVLKNAVQECDQPLYHYSVAGRRQYHFDRQEWTTIRDERLDGAAMLREAETLRDGGVIVFESCSILLREENGDAAMRIRLAHLLSAETTRTGLVLVFLEAPEGERFLPAILADQFVRLNVPYPQGEELLAIATKEVAISSHRARIALSPEHIRSEAERLANGLAGLTRSAARDAVRDALAPDPTDFAAAFERLQTRKACQLSRDLAMNVLDTRDVEMPIGLDYLIDYLAMAREQMRAYGSKRARGALLIGPPGTGKTMLARAIGKLVELPVVEFRISSLMNSLLGETERRFSQAFAVLQAMSPNVVFIDEIEKAFGDSGAEHDGGTMMRVTGSLLSWLSDNPYPNFIVATSNSLRRMGEIGLTMTRSERFDAAFFVDVPNRESRRRMLERWLSGHVQDAPAVASTIADGTEKFSGADIHSLVKQAITQAEHEGRTLGIDLLEAQAARKLNRAAALYGEFDGLRKWGRVYCDPAGPVQD